jgi:hypothetical protein
LHSCAFQCIQQNFIAFYFDAFLICCMLTHSFAFWRIHVGCILVRCISVHLPALHLLHHNAFSIWCISMHFHASIIRCISILCCIIMHLVHVIHSWALPYVCILNMMHISAFRCMLMRCILMHSNYDAFMCINSYSSSRKGNITWFGCAARGAMSMILASWLLHDACECKKIPQHAWVCAQTRGPHKHTQEKPSGLKAKLTWKHAAWTGWASDGLWIRLWIRNASEDLRRANALKCNCIRMHLNQHALQYA